MVASHYVGLGIQSLRKRDQKFIGLENTELAWNSFLGDDGDNMRLRHRSTHRLPAPVFCPLPPLTYSAPLMGRQLMGYARQRLGPSPSF